MFSTGPSLFGNLKESKPANDSPSVEKVSNPSGALGNNTGGVLGKTNIMGGFLGNATGGSVFGNSSSTAGK